MALQQVWCAALSEFQELDALDVARAWVSPESLSAEELCWGLALNQVMKVTFRAPARALIREVRACCLSYSRGCPSIAARQNRPKLRRSY